MKKNRRAEQPKSDAVTLKLGHVVATNDPWHLASLKFAELVDKKSAGKIKVQVFSDGQIGGEKDMLQGMQMGTVDMAVLGTGTIAVVDPKINVLALPYLFRDRDHLNKILSGPIGAEIMEATRKTTSVKTLSYWERGPRHVTNSKKPINIPDDVKGLKLRTPPEELPMAIWRAMGAGPTPMAFGELFTALQQKVVDGQENPLALIASSKFSEVQPYLALTYHTWAPAAFVISDKKFSQMSPENQKILQEAAKETTAYQNELVQKNEEQLVKDLEKAGMKISRPDLKLFRDATKDVHLKFDSMYTKELYDKIQNVK